MEDRIGRLEADTAASHELYDDPLRDDLGERLDRMGREQAADKGISDIKRKLLEDLEG